MVVVLVMLERLEKRPMTALATFPPPIFAGSAFVLWFHVSPSPPHGNASEGGGVFIYDFLGQDDQSGTKTDDIGGSMAKWARVA
jgi:hypothetical protein